MMSSENQSNIYTLVMTITTLIFAVTSLITVYISGSAWRDERESVRPYLTFCSSPEVSYSQKQLSFTFKFQNVGIHPVGSLNSQTIIVDSKLNKKPLHINQFSLVNFISQNSTADLLIKLEGNGLNPHSINEHYIIIDLKYSDPVFEKEHEQIIYLKWKGIIDGQVSPVFHAAKEDRDKIVEYLKKL